MSAAGSLIPDIVLDLQARNVPHAYRPGSADVLVSCPFCSGRLFLSVLQPWHCCTGDLRCPARSMRFEEVLAALVVKAGKA